MHPQSDASGDADARGHPPTVRCWPLTPLPHHDIPPPSLRPWSMPSPSPHLPSGHGLCPHHRPIFPQALVRALTIVPDYSQTPKPNFGNYSIAKRSIVSILLHLVRGQGSEAFLRQESFSNR